MHLSLTSRQTICLLYAVVLLFTGVFGVFCKDPKVTTCCPNTTNRHVKHEILKCAYVRAKGGCKEAYVLTTENNKKHCISVNSKWMISKLEELKNQSRPCEGMPNEVNWRK